MSLGWPGKSRGVSLGAAGRYRRLPAHTIIRSMIYTSFVMVPFRRRRVCHSVRSGGVHGLSLMSIRNIRMTGEYSQIDRGEPPGPVVGFLYTPIFDEAEKKMEKTTTW